MLNVILGERDEVVGPFNPLVVAWRLSGLPKEPPE